MTKMQRRTALPSTLLATLVAAVLAACGGADSSVLQSVTLSGTVASGAASANTQVSAKCATGNLTSTVTTSAAGTWSVNIPGAMLPCLVESFDGTRKMHSVAEGTGYGVATVNVTPLTEQVVGQLSADTAAFYDAFTSALAASIAPDKVKTAQDMVFAALKSSGITVPASVTSLLSSPLIAKAATQAGNDYDALLDTLAATPVAVKLIAINDFHGNIEAPAANNGGTVYLPSATVPAGTTATVGGAAYLATLVRA